MSVVTSNFNHTKEVRTMTAATAHAPAFGREVTRRARPHGFDLAVMRLSLAMLMWARRHSERTAPTRDEHARLMYEAGERARREYGALRMLGRVI